MLSNFTRQYSRNTLAALSVGGLSAVAGTIYLTAMGAKSPQEKKVVVVGGGTAGIGVTAMLKREGVKDVTIVEFSDTHYYQPLWTLVGGGVKDASKSAKPMKDIVARAKCDKWLQK
jgi:sulfide:quinone oxidoreductase